MRSFTAVKYSVGAAEACGSSSVQSISTLSSRLSSRFPRVIYRTSHDSIIFYIIV